MIFEMGANLDGDSFDTSKEDKKKPKSSIREILPKNQHQLVFTFEKRHGKPVTLVGRFHISEDEKKQVLKLLKSKLGCGGSISQEWIEIQGDQKLKIIEILEKDGWKFRKK
ncbi:MAG: translation initiation factor [Campylobacterales bacterium]|nr:translation initiation factor [Campylobacterales bacterium]